MLRKNAQFLFLGLCSVFVYTIYMKKSVVYPDWAEKFRGKGRTIRKVRNGYALFQCTSVYVKGAKYPKSVQKYLGMITEKDGFIPKKSSADPDSYLEYGLSHFILANFKRDLSRSVYGHPTDDILIAGIVYYMFGSVDDIFVLSTYASKGCEDEVLKRTRSGIAIHRLSAISKKISSLIEQKIPDGKDRLLLTKLLFLCVIGKDMDPSSVRYPAVVKETAERYGLVL